MPTQDLLRAKTDPKIAIDPIEVGRVVEDVFPEALGVWIYGSFAHGRARRDSDLDIAILPDRPIDAWEHLERAQDVAERVHREVDLVDLSRSRTYFATRSSPAVFGLLPAIPNIVTCSSW